MQMLKSMFVTAAAALVVSGTALAGPIQFANVNLDPTGAGAFPTGSNAQQVCPEGLTTCANNNFLSPVPNSFTITMLEDGLFSASITDVQSPSSSGVFNTLMFELFDAGNNSLGTGVVGSDLDDVLLGTGVYTMFVVYNYTGGANTGSASWALTMSTSVPTNQVPEPGTLALLGLALAGMGLVHRRRRR